MTAEVFSLNDQLDFAALSGDYNPLHVDPQAARRSLFGRPVVHGIHLALWALEQDATTQQQLKRLSLLFRNPVCIGDEPEVVATETAANRMKLSLHSGANEVAVFEAEFTEPRQSGSVVRRPPGRDEIRLLSPSDIVSGQGRISLELDEAILKCQFPRLAAALPLDQLAVLLATTRLVGMHCPGLFSLYSELHVDFVEPPPDAPPQIEWRVMEFDERFSRVTIDFIAPNARGTIQAFLRPAPQNQPAMSLLTGQVAPGCFAGRRALVIGGSRGLGELCAKLLAAGGADVRLTYHTGAQDAARVVDEIAQSGHGAQAVAFDALDTSTDLAAQLGTGWLPTHVYYFATPTISAGIRRKFSARLFARFCDYYVEGFFRCWERLRNLTNEPLFIFYPSSVFVDEAPANMTEYAVSKAAGERLCRHLSTIDRKLNLQIKRLPRLLSDQTAGMMQMPMGDSIATMLEVLSL